MKKYYVFLLVLLFVSFIATSAIAQSDADDMEETDVELSLSTMILFAMDQNPTLNMARTRIEQMDFFVDEARADYYPKVEASLSGGFEYIAPTAGESNNNPAKLGVVLNQNLFDGFQTASEVERRKELYETANIDLEIEQSDLILEVIGYYLNILRFSQTTQKTEQFVERINEIVGSIEDMVEAGAAGKVMLDYARSRQAASFVLLNEAKSSLNDSVRSLEFLTGPLPAFKAIEPNYLAPEKLDKEFYVNIASVKNTSMSRVASEIKAMDHQISAEKGGFYPSVGVSLEAEQTHNNQGDAGNLRNMKALMSVSYELFDGYERRNRLNRVNSQLTELKYKEHQILNEISRDIDIAYNQIISAQSALKATNVEIQSALALQTLNKENFRLGEINAIELIEGEERLQGAYSRKYDLEQKLYQNIYTLLINSSIIGENYFCKLCGENNDL